MAVVGLVSLSLPQYDGRVVDHLQASPIFQELGKASSAYAAGLVGVISIANGLGRVFWAWISDVTTRKVAFFLMYLIEAILFWNYHSITSLVLLVIFTFILVCDYEAGMA